MMAHPTRILAASYGIAVLVLCVLFQLVTSQPCANVSYPPYDGECNNKQNPSWGSVGAEFIRYPVTVAQYDKNGNMGGAGRPDVRAVSVGLIGSPYIKLQASDRSTDILTAVGQFISHEINRRENTPNTTIVLLDGTVASAFINMTVPDGDPYYVIQPTNIKRRPIPLIRSNFKVVNGTRQQTNALSAFVDTALLPHARYEALEEGAAAGSDTPVSMFLNGAALENLDILENSAGGNAGTLLCLLDHCSTPFGRRRLRRWLVRPLFRVADIERRQDAIEDLLGPGVDASGAARRQLAGMSDLERSLTRLSAAVADGGGGIGREAAHVVLYEDNAKRRVKALVGAVRDLQALARALKCFQKCDGLKSELLLALIDPTRWADMDSSLQELSDAADWGEAETSGRVVPSKGADEGFDAACEAVQAAEQALQEYLQHIRKQFRCRDISYITLNKESHVLEVPDGVADAMGESFDMVGHRKGFRRYMTEELKELVKDLAAAQDMREKALGGILQILEQRFVAKKDLWSSAVEAVAVLDALMAVAGATLHADGNMCRPKMVEPSDGDDADVSSGPFFQAVQLRHPAGICGKDGSFVPNDVSIGGAGGPRFLVLTGPNMGGKSTMLRQACLAVVLAQIGAWVPAESLTMFPMDALFVRMGARDHILSGQSTFFVELSETAAMLQRATARSLVALDELGRGTATLDGAAIAAAVLDHLAHQTGCCGLFATHYHQLAEAHDSDPTVSIMHMACAVAEETSEGTTQPGVQEVTFLYKLTPGSCPRSYGTNVAKLAGLPAAVVHRAGQISAERRLDANCKHLNTQQHAQQDQAAASAAVNHQQHQQQDGVLTSKQEGVTSAPMDVDVDHQQAEPHSSKVPGTCTKQPAHLESAGEDTDALLAMVSDIVIDLRRWEDTDALLAMVSDIVIDLRRMGYRGPDASDGLAPVLPADAVHQQLKQLQTKAAAAGCNAADLL
eukprot:jgi/Chrzof1/13453/Cz07g33220.t1